MQIYFEMLKEAFLPITTIIIGLIAYFYKRKSKNLEKELSATQADSKTVVIKNDIKHLETKTKEVNDEFNKAVSDFNDSVDKFYSTFRGSKTMSKRDKSSNNNH
jgi:metal-responsive CopG/Arc/MetJ family transcriptional regulator